MGTERARAFRVAGMDCAEEIAALRRELGPIVGGEARLGFDLLRGRMTVDAEARRVPDAAIFAAVRRAGLTAELWRAAGDARDGHGDRSGDRLRQRRRLLTVLSGAATAAGFLVHALLAGGFGAALGREGLGGEQPVPLLARLLYAAGIAAGLSRSCRRPGWRCGGCAPT